MTRGNSATMAARLLLLAMWPTAWALSLATLRGWRHLTEHGLSVDDAVGVGMMGMGAVASAYLALVTIPLLMSSSRGSSGQRVWLHKITPHAWRHVVAIAAGGAVSVTIATGAVATAPDAAEDAGTTHSVTASRYDANAPEFEVSSAGWVASPAEAPLPDARNSSAPPAISPNDGAPPLSHSVPQDKTEAMQAPKAPTTAARHEIPETVKVKRGDSLWLICAELLPPAATEAEIARAWPLLYRANKGAIGTNPSLIYAGQVLQVPEGLHS